jgi:uncharacterized protein (TIGR03435 family)
MGGIRWCWITTSALGVLPIHLPADVPLQPSLGTAVKEQLGLRFEQGPAPFRLVTVESAQPPVAN